MGKDQSGTIIAVSAAAVVGIFAVAVLAPVLAKKNHPVNSKIKKKEAKVVDFVNCDDMENLGTFKDGKLVMCRCWKSTSFPYCDGSHTAHNQETNDNVGPLILKKTAKK
uniref:Iron-binding zinc finger CDGSH type domain-containing protein n=1 Tax=Chromera velia CCMP2878 TaxID=1169474 RepID=A0A0G4HSV7_9ALVE|mmetsp:Transcript_2895/g.5958  ORF Transcript_2895/g.5958 Transcript_2895/m.5958 type:complete len:109 (-) Transcript_2895:173-499(-)|eukprot:Cvel_8316.t1-p1 / transcript=Cvel_8316.t1 / gene=Cvel_8316 / organism=Chromera_velia_CCMP2878 / gene_product=CDGSH iron-sulfur domain-containing protein 2, putative / transcript_product=CDGSH iron-sulfur domain-containing protein 2, putative / location=Cvel_scaffold456:87371-87694(+) / protein_length=108 / sequence_SO=supercontig / SO=protein_coding / is_pseudo=false